LEIWCLFGSIALGYSYWVVSFMGVHGFIRIYENNMMKEKREEEERVKGHTEGFSPAT
jgi:hypothetical protein